jgi:hypothetical protein
MPIIAYSCGDSHIIKKFFRSASNAPTSFVCEKCGANMKKLLSSPYSQSKLLVDNGIQARAVEINLDVIEANQERAKKDYREE